MPPLHDVSHDNDDLSLIASPLRDVSNDNESASPIAPVLRDVSDDNDYDIADVLMLDVECDSTNVSDVSDDDDDASLLVSPLPGDVSDDDDSSSLIVSPLPGDQSSQATDTPAAADTAEVILNRFSFSYCLSEKSSNIAFKYTVVLLLQNILHYLILTNIETRFKYVTVPLCQGRATGPGQVQPSPEGRNDGKVRGHQGELMLHVCDSCTEFRFPNTGPTVLSKK